MSRLASELVMCSSAVDIKNHGMPNSTTPKITIHLRFFHSAGN